MKNFGFVKVAAAVPLVHLANCNLNAQAIVALMREASESGVQLITFPELCITGYTCADLFHSTLLIDEAEKALAHILAESQALDIVGIVGMPVRQGNQLFNSAVAFRRGTILGVVPKSFLPNYAEFYEQRWFASANEAQANSIALCQQQVPFGSDLIFEAAEATFAIELCEDLWAPIPPSSRLALGGAQIVCNLSASNELVGKHAYLRNLIAQQSARTIAGYIYASAGFGESSTDLAFAGNGIVAECGTILTESTRFSLKNQLIISEIDIEHIRCDRQRNSTFRQSAQEPFRHIACELPQTPLQLTRHFSPTPFIPEGDTMSTTCEEIFDIQTNALATRMQATGIQTLVLGISGGLDSTLALLACARTCDKLGLPRTNIIGITMPGFGTTGRTYKNAIELIENLGATLREISIRNACTQHFQDIGHDAAKHDATYENTQARERTQILMDVANQTNGLVVGTGDLSELALGWATYNGDHMSMYGINAGIPKTLVRHLVRYAAQCDYAAPARQNLIDIIDTPVSPELLPADQNDKITQKTEDLVGPYELHDFFLFYTLRFGFAPAKIFLLAQQAFGNQYPHDTLKKWLRVFLRRFFTQQFKRSCMPDGPKIGSVCLSPRGDWRMPSDASAKLWLDEADSL